MTEMQPARALPRAEDATWTIADSETLYGVRAWGKGAFRAAANGHLVVHPNGDANHCIDLYEVVESLRERGVHPPVLIRLYDVLAARLKGIRRAFDVAIEATGYRGRYRGLYPVKVNQERHLCESIRDLANEIDFGLEAGSKPELLAVLGLTAQHPRIPIVCNGFKDQEFLETVTLAAKLRRDIVPIIENPSELEMMVDLAREHGVRPRLGIRMKLYASAESHWEASGGSRSKFGLHASEVMAAVEVLRKAEMLDCLYLVHCHVGSQVSKLESLRGPLEELARTYVELSRMGTGVAAIDVGGGLGVDYDGTNSGRGSSVDYDERQYAKFVVGLLHGVCENAGVPHPDIFSESGRAMVAGSSVLVIDVLERRQFQSATAQFPRRADLPQSVKRLQTLANQAERAASIATKETAARLLDNVMTQYRAGKIGLGARAYAEDMFARIARAVAWQGRLSDDPELLELASTWSDVYVVNFSLFQSLPDSWALNQVFPTCPIHRLDERPTRCAVLADVTCDSDGKVDRFALAGGERRALEVHELRSEPYYLGIYLVGAYQEILGDLHNLFGDTHAVHVSIDEEDGTWSLDEFVPGDTVRDVLGYVHYDVDQLLEHIRREVERAIRTNVLTVAEGKNLLSNVALSLNGYTYLE